MTKYLRLSYPKQTGLIRKLFTNNCVLLIEFWDHILNKNYIHTLPTKTVLYSSNRSWRVVQSDFECVILDVYWKTLNLDFGQFC